VTKLTLSAPLSGWVTTLEEVPDPVFSQRMIGDGAAIDPIDSILRAPCDGEILLIADARHAVTMRADCGAEILMHVGIDTVGLRGAGLEAHVKAGHRVQRGDALLSLDLDRLIYGARSLVTPIVVTNTDRFRIRVLTQKVRLAAGDPFMELVETAIEGLLQGDSASPIARSPDASETLTVRLEHGIHARPAAQVARASRQFEARITVSAHGREADAGSTTALMALGVKCGDDIEVRAYGPGAADAVREVSRQIAVLSCAARSRPGDLRPLAATERSAVPEVPDAIRGIGASRGIAIGSAQRFEQARTSVPERGSDPRHEAAELERALASARERLEQLISDSGNEVLAAHVELLSDSQLLREARAALQEGKSAGRAWQIAISAAKESLLVTGDGRLAERTADLRDVEEQVIEALLPSADEGRFDAIDNAIIVAAELLPSQLARLDLRKVAGICSAEGGATSHVALLAASMNIPALVGAGSSILNIADGTPLILDANDGILYPNPSAGQLASATKRVDERRLQSAAWLRDAAKECYTADGCRIEVFANLASEAEALDAMKNGAEGCGLLRTEFMFLERNTAPREDEQAAEYQLIADALGSRPLVIRTLDAGGDKPIPYLPLPREENPLLGLRGLRSALLFPQFLRDQLGAIARVTPPARILLPMVTDAGEIRSVRKLLEALVQERKVDAMPLLGAMIETPASVVMAPSIVQEVDFLSIGSNDLAQYTLAMDRSHPTLAGNFDHFHPAVLRQIAAVCRAAAPANCPVSVCGALASEPGTAGILVGLGVRVLSVVPDAIPELKSVIRHYRLDDCVRLAQSAIDEDSASVIRKLAEDFYASARSAA
jgi:multiphosphoryl transfer protein